MRRFRTGPLFFCRIGDILFTEHKFFFSCSCSMLRVGLCIAVCILLFFFTLASASGFLLDIISTPLLLLHRYLVPFNVCIQYNLVLVSTLSLPFLSSCEAMCLTRDGGFSKVGPFSSGIPYFWIWSYKLFVTGGADFA